MGLRKTIGTNVNTADAMADPTPTGVEFSCVDNGDIRQSCSHHLMYAHHAKIEMDWFAGGWFSSLAVALK